MYFSIILCRNLHFKLFFFKNCYNISLINFEDFQVKCEFLDEIMVASTEGSDKLKGTQPAVRDGCEMGNNEEGYKKPYGLSTRVALARLHEEILNVVTVYESKFRSER